MPPEARCCLFLNQFWKATIFISTLIHDVKFANGDFKSQFIYGKEHGNVKEAKGKVIKKKKDITAILSGEKNPSFLMKAPSPATGALPGFWCPGTLRFSREWSEALELCVPVRPLMTTANLLLPRPSQWGKGAGCGGMEGPVAQSPPLCLSFPLLSLSQLGRRRAQGKGTAQALVFEMKVESCEDAFSSSYTPVPREPHLAEETPALSD